MVHVVFQAAVHVQTMMMNVKTLLLQGPYSASALVCMQSFHEEFMSDADLKVEFQKMESATVGVDGPVTGWVKVDSLMRQVRQHLKKRSLADNPEGRAGGDGVSQYFLLHGLDSHCFNRWFW